MVVTSNRDFRRKGHQKDVFGGIHPAVMAWRRVVITNNGGTPSTKTMLAMDWFYRHLLKSPFFNKLLIVNCIAPDSLIAASIPLINKGGFTVWVNTSFVAGDISVAGIQGNQAGLKSFDTGVVPSNVFSSDNSGGITQYVTTNGGTGCPIGVQNTAGSSACELIFSSTGQSLRIYDTASALNSSITTFKGYVSINRIGTNGNIYLNSSSINHQSFASSASLSGSRPTRAAYFMAVNQYNGSIDSAISQGGEKSSFAAFHEGLTENESRIFAVLIQLFRQKLGGGFF